MNSIIFPKFPIAKLTTVKRLLAIAAGRFLPYKEDFPVVGSFMCDFKDKAQQQCIIAGEFDGHGGQKCAKFLSQNLSTILAEVLKGTSLEDDAEILNALNAACVRLDENWCESSDFDASGAVGSLVVIIGNTLWSVNVGDGKIVYNNNGTAIYLSEDADVTDPKYAADAIERGGILITEEGEEQPRLLGRAMTKSWGDFYTIKKDDKEIKIKTPGMSPLGQILKRIFDPEEVNQFVLLGSDGLFDGWSPKEVVDYIQLYAEANLSPITMAKRVVIKSFATWGSQDDSTGLVIQLSQKF